MIPEKSRALRIIAGLLFLILMLQVTLVILHFNPREVKSPPATFTTGDIQQDVADVLLKLQLASAEPEVRKVVGQLKDALPARDAPQSQILLIENVRVEAATGIGNISVSALLRNQFRQPVEDLTCRLQLRDAQGELVYQAAGVPTLATPFLWYPDDRLLIRFLVDNPPEFKQAEVILERLTFRVDGF